MNIRNVVKALFVSCASLLSMGYIVAQEADSVSITNLGYEVNLATEEVTAAVGIAKAKDLSKYFAINPTNALYGQIPGLTVRQNSGNWWAQNATLRVRGQSNLDNTSAPLVLIDGFERDMSTITVQEIESVTVLKDAGATAIYGQRGANGVILITSKRGKNEGMVVDFSYEYSTNQAFRLPKMLNAYGYASAMNEALALDGKEYLYSKEKLDAYKNGTFPEYYPNVNWFEEVLANTGFVQDFNGTFRGGNERSRYFVAINYMEGDGLLKQDRNDNDYSTQLSYRRANLRTNLDIALTKTTHLKFNLAGRISGTNQPGRSTGPNLLSLMYNTPANALPVHYADKMWGGTSIYSQNPVAQVNATGFSTTHERTFYGDLTLTQDLSAIAKGLSVSGAVAFDNNVAYNDQKRREYAYYFRTAQIDEVNGLLYDHTSTTYGEETPLSFNTSFGGQNRQTNAIIRANYDREWGKHKINALALFHADNQIGLGQNNEFHRINYATQLHYVYNKRYLADVTLSYSGNNILSKENRFQYYPAISLGWLISEETFLSGADQIQLLKLRASAGLSGLEQNSMYLHLERYGGGTGYFYADNNVSLGGLQESRRANLHVLPEKNKQINVGLDAQLFEKLLLNADIFYQERSNILVSDANSISQVIGVWGTLASDGIVENKGFELAALWHDKIGDFSYSLGVQYSFARNKIIQQNEIFREWDYLKRTGHSVGQTFGLEHVGFWGLNDGLDGVTNITPQGVEYTYTSVLKPGDVKYVDQNGDNKIDEFDMVAIGKPGFPEINFAFNLGAEYKGVGLNAVFQGLANVTVNLNTPSIFWPLYNNNNISEFSNDRWTPATAATATLPRLTPEMNQNNYRASTVWRRDASFLKLRLLEAYYHLPENIVKLARLKRVKIFVRGLNLFSIDNIKIMDPEAIGADYPTLRSYNVGLNVGF